MNIFPVDAVTTVTSGITGALTANMPVLIGILATVVGIKWALKLLNKSTKGRV